MLKNRLAISTLQEYLKELGYYNGSVTGEYEEELKKSLEQFQTKEGLQHTGFADEETVNILAFRCAAADSLDMS